MICVFEELLGVRIVILGKLELMLILGDFHGGSEGTFLQLDWFL